MTELPSKARIRTAFSASAPHYDEVADVQTRVARQLVEAVGLSHAERILDAGSGTGKVSHLLREGSPTATVLALDHAYAMCAHANLPQTLCADIEQLPLAADSLELYCSSLAWQWVSPQRAAQEALRVLKPAGRLAVASLASETFVELRFAFSAVDDHTHVLHFLSAEEYISILAQAGFTNIRMSRDPIRVYAPDLPTHIARIRSLGASQLGRQRRHGLLGRRAWHTLLAAYETLRERKGLPLTYDALYLFATKP